MGFAAAESRMGGRPRWLPMSWRFRCHVGEFLRRPSINRLVEPYSLVEPSSIELAR